jgi:hypothetical protein
MKLTVLRKRFLLLVLPLLLGLALPVQGIHIKRAVPYRTDIYQVAPGAKIVVRTNQAASLGDLRIGDRVSLAYAEQNGTLLVHRIADGMARGTANVRGTNSVATGAAPKPHAQGKVGALIHVHGIVRAINLQAGTVTVTHRAQ